MPTKCCWAGPVACGMESSGFGVDSSTSIVMGVSGLSAGAILNRSSLNVPDAWLIVGVQLLNAGATLLGAELSLL